MKNLLNGSASASSEHANDLVSPLQNQLLIELLKKNIDLANRTSSQENHIILGPSSLPNSEPSHSLANICRDIDRMISHLSSVSHELSRTMIAKQSIGLSGHQILAYLRMIQELKESLAETETIKDLQSFDRARENVVSLVNFLTKDKKRAETVNDEYVDKICRLRVRLDDSRQQIHHFLTLIQQVKDRLRSIANHVVDFDHIKDSVMEHINNHHIDSIQKMMQTFNVPVDEFSSLDAVLSRMNSVLWKVVCAEKQQKKKIQQYKSKIDSLSSLLADSQAILDAQEEEFAERCKSYEDQIARLKLELEEAKAREQTTPPTSATRKRRVLVETVIAFTGYSRDPDNLQKLTDIAINVLHCRVHLSADFISDITHVVCPAGYQSVRTMAAALSSKWIMSADWLTESAKAGHLLPENAFGHLHLDGPSILRTKSFSLTPAFIAQQSAHQMNAACCKTLIEPIGKGRIVDNSETSDFVLCGDKEERKNRRWLRLKDFIRMIPGHST